MREQGGGNPIIDTIPLAFVYYGGTFVVSNFLNEISNHDSQAPIASHTMKLLGREKGLMVGSAVGKLDTLSRVLK